jgi:hypothetical protein
LSLVRQVNWSIDLESEFCRPHHKIKRKRKALGDTEGTNGS